MAQTGDRVRNRLSAMDDATRMEGTTEKPEGSCRARYVCFMSIRAVQGQCLINPEQQVTAFIPPPIVQVPFG
jgi:hypothetical protein